MPGAHGADHLSTKPQPPHGNSQPRIPPGTARRPLDLYLELPDWHKRFDNWLTAAASNPHQWAMRAATGARAEPGAPGAQREFVYGGHGAVCSNPQPRVV